MTETLHLEEGMPVDENDFFREATLRICESLIIEKSLWRCLSYIKDYIPAEESALHCYSPGMGTVTLYAIADREGGKYVNLPTAYPPEIRALMQKDEYSRGYVTNRADEHPLAGPVLRAMGRGKSSLIVVRLILEEQWLGSVSFWAEGWDQFTEEHLRLLSLLREPFAIALSNNLRYRELLELKDLLVDDNRYLHDELQRISGAEIIGADFGLRGVMEMVRQDG